jgi:hypothetical protein
MRSVVMGGMLASTNVTTVTFTMEMAVILTALLNMDMTVLGDLSTHQTLARKDVATA